MATLTSALWIKPGTKIAAYAEAAGDRTFEGKVSRLDSRIDPVTRSIAARASLPTRAWQSMGRCFGPDADRPL